VGLVEILAGVVVAFKPRYGGYLVAAWLGGIIVNLLTLADYYDIALRDFGLSLGALSLARLAVAHEAMSKAPARMREAAAAVLLLASLVGLSGCSTLGLAYRISTA